jgi:hypothetical protein
MESTPASFEFVDGHRPKIASCKNEVREGAQPNGA